MSRYSTLSGNSGEVALFAKYGFLVQWLMAVEIIAINSVICNAEHNMRGYMFFYRLYIYHPILIQGDNRKGRKKNVSIIIIIIL